MERGAEIILPFPRTMEEATAFRSTWLVSSLAALRDLGKFEQYLQELPASYHEAILMSVAGVWLPIEVAAAHYEAFGRMQLQQADLKKMARAVTERVHGTALGTVVVLAKQSGVTPWHVMGQLNRFWERVWLGGGLQVSKLGEKDALIEIGAWPISNLPYVHQAMPSVTEAILALFCRRAFVRVLTARCRKHSLVMQASWA